MEGTAIAGKEVGDGAALADTSTVERFPKARSIIAVRGSAPPRHQRTFQVVFALLTLEFIGLGISYLADPAGSVRGFSRWNQFLGGIPLVGPDVAPWRYVTAVGMITVGLMAAMVLVDLRRNYTMILPIAFFKAFNAGMWFWYAARYGAGHLPVFYAAAVFDCVQVLAMVVVGGLAYRSMVRRAGTP